MYTDIRYQILRLAVSTLEMQQLKWITVDAQESSIQSTKYLLLPSSFTVSDIASLSSFSTSTCTASLEPLKQPSYHQDLTEADNKRPT